MSLDAIFALTEGIVNYNCNLEDVLFVDSGDPWNPSPSTVDKVIAMLKCVHRVLRQDGTYISISFGQVNKPNCCFVF